MKNSDLITRLQEYPMDMEVCILDAAENNKTDEETGRGIHREINVYQVMTDEELQQLQEENPKAKHWIAIEFNDDDISKTSQDKFEEFGKIIDSLENITYAIKLPLPSEIHIKELKIELPEKVNQLKNVFIDITGDNPWA